MTNQAQWHTGQRVNVAGRSTVGTIITIGDEWNRPSCQGKLLICFGVEDGGNGYSFWYKVEKVTAITPANPFDPDFANVGKAGHCPSCGTSSYDGACMYCGYVGDDAPQIETVTDEPARRARTTCPVCGSENVFYHGVDDGGGDYGDQVCDTYHCEDCGQYFEDCWGVSENYEPLPPSEEETLAPGESLTGIDFDDIPFDHGYGGGGGVLSARERYALTWRYARLLELLDKAGADANYEYATTFCSNCPGSDGDCCKDGDNDEAWEFFAGGSMQRAHDLTKRINELIPDRTVIDRSILGECRRLLQIRNHYPVPLVNRPLLWQLYHWHCKARAYGVTGISGRAFLESYHANGWNEKLALDALLAAGGGGGGYETEFMTVRQAWIHDESVLAAADMDIEQTLRDGWTLHQITYVAHTEGDVRYVTFTRVSGEHGGGGGYDKAMPTDAEQVRLDAAMNCLVRMPSSLLPREDQQLLIEIGGFLMARTEDNKARALAAVDRWFEAWAAELDQELPTMDCDEDTPILGMTPVYSAGGGGGGYDDRAELNRDELIWVACFNCNGAGSVPVDDGTNPGLVECPCCEGRGGWFELRPLRDYLLPEVMKAAGGGDPLGLHRPRRIHAIYTPTPRPVRATEIAQDVQGLIEAGLIQPMVWGDPDQCTYVITPAGMDYLQMETGE